MIHAVPIPRIVRSYALVGLLFTVAFLSACSPPPTNQIQGYVEGEFVYVAAPLAGQLDALSVSRGGQVQAGDALFSLERGSETAARDEAERRLAQAQSNLEDAKKGKRPTEIQSIQAQLEQARAALAFSEKAFNRTEGLLKTSDVTQQETDQSRATRDQDRQRVAQLEADLQTGRLGQRSDLIAVAEAEVQARRYALAQAQWNLSQKHQAAPRAGLVFDTLYRQGEWVAAGHPVVALLPPENIKVRAFVPEGRVGTLHPGDSIRVTVDGVASPYPGKISFISPRSEYTPPVIYSQESRGKLVFLIEITFDAKTATLLHPGQPVDVLLGQ